MEVISLFLSFLSSFCASDVSSVLWLSPPLAFKVFWLKCGLCSPQANYDYFCQIFLLLIIFITSRRQPSNKSTTLFSVTCCYSSLFTLCCMYEKSLLIHSQVDVSLSKRNIFSQNFSVLFFSFNFVFFFSMQFVPKRDNILYLLNFLPCIAFSLSHFSTFIRNFHNRMNMSSSIFSLACQ
jgi:hypothetical protein